MDIVVNGFRDLHIAKVPVVGPAQGIVIEEAVPGEYLLPVVQVGQVLLYRLRQSHGVADIGRYLYRREGGGVGLFKGPADGGEHEAKPFRVPQSRRFRRVQKLLIEQEYNFGRKSRLGQGLIHIVEDLDVLVRHRGLLAVLAGTHIVEVVRQPDVEVVHPRGFLGVAHHLVHQPLPGLRVGVAQVRIGGDALPEAPLAVYQGYQVFLLRLPVRFVPAGAGEAQGLGGPAVAHPVAADAPEGHSLLHLPVQAVQLLPGQRFRRQAGIVGVQIPALKENIRLLELQKEGVEAVFRQPIDKIQGFLQAIRSLDADAPVGIAGGKRLLFRFQVLMAVNLRHVGAALAGVEEHKANGAQVVINPQQHISRGAACKSGLSVPDTVAVVPAAGQLSHDLKIPAPPFRQQGQMVPEGPLREGQGLVLHSYTPFSTYFDYIL